MFPRLQDTGVLFRPQRQPVWTVDPNAAERVDRDGDVARVALAVLAEGDRFVWRCFGDTSDGGGLQSMEDGCVLRSGDAA